MKRLIAAAAALTLAAWLFAGCASDVPSGTQGGAEGGTVPSVPDISVKPDTGGESALVLPDAPRDIPAEYFTRADNGKNGNVYYSVKDGQLCAAMGVPTEYHSYAGLEHGFGLGIGTVAEGRFDLAVSFWETQAKGLATDFATWRYMSADLVSYLYRATSSRNFFSFKISLVTYSPSWNTA